MRERPFKFTLPLLSNEIVEIRHGFIGYTMEARSQESERFWNSKGAVFLHEGRETADEVSFRPLER